MQRRRAAAIDRVDGGTGGDQGTGVVVPEPGRGQVQGRVAPVEQVGQSATKRSSSMRCAAPASVIRDGSFARTASKMGSTIQHARRVGQFDLRAAGGTMGRQSAAA